MGEAREKPLLPLQVLDGLEYLHSNLQRKGERVAVGGHHQSLLWQTNILGTKNPMLRPHIYSMFRYIVYL